MDFILSKIDKDVREKNIENQNINKLIIDKPDIRLIDIAIKNCKINEIIIKCEPTPNKSYTFLKRIAKNNIELKNCEIEKISYSDDIKYCAKIIDFDSCNIKQIRLPKNLRIIASHFFCGNNIIHDITFNDKLTVIEESAFQNNNILSPIHLPDSVKCIETGAFLNCELKDINMGNVPYIEENAFSGKFADKFKAKKDIDYIMDDDTFYKNVSSNIQEVNIPEHIKYIAPCAFANQLLEKITLPEGLKEIGYEAFECTNIKEINIPSSVKKIDIACFCLCPDLKKVTLPEKITNIPYATFHKSGVENINLENIEEIGAFAFFGTKIKNLKLDNIKEIFHFAFGCASIEYATFSSYIKEIPQLCFSHSKIGKIILPEQLESIEYAAFEKSNAIIDLPKHLKTIGDRALCTDNILEEHEIMIPDTIKSIGSNAFSSAATIVLTQKQFDLFYDNLKFYTIKIQKPTLEGLIEQGKSMSEINKILKDLENEKEI